MKRIVCLLEGLTDRPLKDLGGLTPLQKAPTPNLDALATQGELAAVVPPKDCRTEEAALMRLLGYAGDLDAVRRGPLEACAFGIFMEEDEVAFSVRFVSSGEGVIVDVSDEVLSDSEGKLLCQALTEGMGKSNCRFVPIAGPRAVLITGHPALVNAAPCDTPHPVDAIGRPWLDLLGKDSEVKEVLRDASKLLADHEINALREDLEERPVNALLLSEGGPSFSFQPAISSKTLVCTTTPSLIGAAKMAGIGVWTFPAEQRKFHHLRTLLKRLDNETKEVDYLIIVVPYLWRSTYKGDLLEKVKTTEWLDRNFVSPLHDWCQKEGCELVVSTLRHSDISEGRMVDGPVIALRAPAKDKKPLSRFSFDEGLLSQIDKQLELSDLFSF